MYKFLLIAVIIVFINLPGSFFIPVFSIEDGITITDSTPLTPISSKSAGSGWIDMTASSSTCFVFRSFFSLPVTVAGSTISIKTKSIIYEYLDKTLFNKEKRSYIVYYYNLFRYCYLSGR